MNGKPTGVVDLTPYLLPGLHRDKIAAAYLAAPGRELESGKFASPESSSALVANTFGLFLENPGILPEFPVGLVLDRPFKSISLEAVLRFPWRGGRHPCLDVLLTTP